MPALSLSVAALAAIGAAAALALPPLLATSPAAAAAAASRVVVEQAPAPAPDPQDPPALRVVRQVLGERADFGQVVPAPFGCDIPQAVISATASAPEGQVGLFVLPAGYGGSWREVLLRCGRSSALVPGAEAVRMLVDGGQVLAWSRGDVLVTLAASSPTPEAAAVDQRVLAALSPVCLDLDPLPGDAKRNPRHPAHSQLTVGVEVSIEASGVAAADLSAVEAPLQPPQMVMPAGVSGPPPPAAPERPGQLSGPGPEVLSAVVQVPAVDEGGPGCGWSFTAAAPPSRDEASMAEQADRALAEARAELLRGQAEWLVATAAVENGLAAHVATVGAWNDYVEQASVVRQSWDDQASAIARWRQERKEWEGQVAARTAWLGERDGASAAHEQAMKSCAGQSSSTSLPSASGCPVERPSILNDPEPLVGPEPAPPALWSP